MVVLPLLALSVKTWGGAETGKCYHGDSRAVQVGWGRKRERGVCPESILMDLFWEDSCWGLDYKTPKDFHLIGLGLLIRKHQTTSRGSSRFSEGRWQVASHNLPLLPLSYTKLSNSPEASQAKAPLLDQSHSQKLPIKIPRQRFSSDRIGPR